MLPRLLPVEGRPNPNLPVRAKFPRKPEPPYRGRFDTVWTEGPTGALVRVKAPRHQSPRIKRAVLRFRGPWKCPRL